MYNTKQITHVIRPGDTLYHLAEHYETTVQMILSANPDVNPQDLRIGSTLVIFPGKDYYHADSPASDALSSVGKKVALINDMRLAWSQHVYWTRMLLISIAHKLPDEAATANTLLQNPKVIADIFGRYYPPQVAVVIEQLLTEHLQIGGELITALRDGKTGEAARLNREWYINADKMADAFSSINPYYKREEMQEMLYKHLELTTQEVAARLVGNYPEDILAFFEVEREAMMMADHFSAGIIRQFPEKFRGR